MTQPGWRQTAPPTQTYNATVVAGQVTTGLDFANQQLPIPPPNRPPVITSTAPETVQAGQRYLYNLTMTDPDDDPLHFDLPVSPDGMVIDPDTGVIVWTPTDRQVGLDRVIVRVQERNRLVVKHYPDGTSVGFTYTATGQRATETDDRGTTRYTYDAAGNRTAVTTPAGTTSYVFDPLNRQAAVTGPDGGVTSFTCDAAGNLTKTQLPNGPAEVRSYDKLNRLTFLENLGPAGLISSYTYTLGPTGRRDAVVEDTGRRVDYSYDALDRLTQEKVTDAAFGDRTIAYTYDAVGNRLTRNDSAPARASPATPMTPTTAS